MVPKKQVLSAVREEKQTDLRLLDRLGETLRRGPQECSLGTQSCFVLLMAHNQEDSGLGLVSGIACEVPFASSQFFKQSRLEEVGESGCQTYDIFLS